MLRLYVKAKAEPTWRFWGIYVHVCKRETLREAYLLAKANDGAPGIDGVTFAAVEAGGSEKFLEQLREELVQQTYRPQGARNKTATVAQNAKRPLDPSGLKSLKMRCGEGDLNPHGIAPASTSS
jgi:hypothetical protein